VHLVPSTGFADAIADGADDRRAAVTWSAAGHAAGATLPVHHALPDDAEGYAAGLYAALHAVDEAGCTDVYVEAPPLDPAWAGVRDRLTRAAHP
jgi:L-threonylcarbamoyladenylate synthase